MSTDTELQSAIDAFDDEGGLNSIDRIKDELSSSHGDMQDLVGSLRKIEDALDEIDNDEADVLSARLADVIRALEEATDHIDKAYDGMVYADTDILQEIRDVDTDDEGDES